MAPTSDVVVAICPKACMPRNGKRAAADKKCFIRDFHSGSPNGCRDTQGFPTSLKLRATIKADWVASCLLNIAHFGGKSMRNPNLPFVHPRPRPVTRYTAKVPSQ